MLYYF